VNDYCSCGAQLPEDAKFCHKCGKPQGDLLEPETVEPVQAAVPVLPLPVAGEPAPPAAVADKPSVVSWRNPVAVRAAFAAGAACAMLIIVPMPAVLQLLWQLILLFAGGFFAVYLYNRRTKAQASPRAGAALGWMAGMFCFLIMLVLFTVSVVAMSSADGGLQASFREMISQRGNAEVAQQFNEWLESPSGVGTLLFLILTTTFFMLTLVPALGGLLAAKVLEKD
jgi:hypothetical protein